MTNKVHDGIGAKRFRVYWSMGKRTPFAFHCTHEMRVEFLDAENRPILDDTGHRSEWLDFIAHTDKVECPKLADSLRSMAKFMDRNPESGWRK